MGLYNKLKVLITPDTSSVLKEMDGKYDKLFGELGHTIYGPDSNYKISQEHLDIVAGYTKTSREDTAKILHDLIDADTLGTTPTEKHNRVEEIGKLAEKVKGPNKESLMEALKKEGLGSPLVKPEDVPKIEEAAQKGIIEGKFFRLAKQPDGSLTFMQKTTSGDKPTTITQTTFQLQNESRQYGGINPLTPYFVDMDNILNTLEITAQLGHGRFNGNDVQKFKTEQQAGKDQCEKTCGPQAPTTRGLRPM